MRDDTRRYVIVSGPPASGKSTLAPAIAAHLDLPLSPRTRSRKR